MRNSAWPTTGAHRIGLGQYGQLLDITRTDAATQRPIHCVRLRQRLRDSSRWNHVIHFTVTNYTHPGWQPTASCRARQSKNRRLEQLAEYRNHTAGANQLWNRMAGLYHASGDFHIGSAFMGPACGAGSGSTVDDGLCPAVVCMALCDREDGIPIRRATSEEALRAAPRAPILGCHRSSW